MRLLKYDDRGELSLTKDILFEQAPDYAILSHTWGDDQDEVSLQDIEHGLNKSKAGYKKLQFCGQQAARDELQYFWVDTCCIDRKSSTELSKNINLMFRYYQRSQKCYVYLSDVDDVAWKKELDDCRWFKRGWTLQELLAPKCVEFYAKGQRHIGSRTSLEHQIYRITHIPLSALHGADLSQFDKDERMRWAAGRDTKEEEDQAYCLLGIFDVCMSLIYGEGKESALNRLGNKIRKKSKPPSQIDTRIRDYYLGYGRLDVERLSGHHLSMETCFVNLAVIERSKVSTRNQEVFDVKKNIFNLADRLKVETPPASKQVTLPTLFDSQTFNKGATSKSHRVVIWGRAGMGKTTLCKKLVHDFYHNDLWHHLYDRVFWIPLRKLRLVRDKVKTVAKMIQDVCIQNGLLPTDALNDILDRASDRCLFILDGLDEVSFAIDHDSPLGANLDTLLRQENIIITSRPHRTSILSHVPLDLELQTIGFFPEQVEEFLHKEIEYGDAPQSTVTAIRNFIGQPVIQSLVRIPIQLDAVCYVWNQGQLQQDEMTMTLLYQAITDQLWKKDIVRLRLKHNGEHITAQQIQDYTNYRLFVNIESSCLEELAFAGLHSQLIEFTPATINAIAGGEIPLLDSRLSQLSFLRSSDSLEKPTNQTYHFIHFTFQEFFAAQYFVRHWLSDKAMVFPRMTPAEQQRFKDVQTISPIDFLKKEKYRSRYDIFWRFVVGLLQVEPGDRALDRFFQELENEPYDLVGLAHQMLVVHCLNEVVGDQRPFRVKAKELEHKYQSWTELNETIANNYFLLERAECPFSVLRHYLEGSDARKGHAMRALATRTYIPPEVLDTVVQEGQGTNRPLQKCALIALARHCDQLSHERFISLFAVRNIDVWSRACREVGARMGTTLLKHITQLLQHESSHVRLCAVKVFEWWTADPPVSMALITQLLQDQCADVRLQTIRLIRRLINLPESAIESLIPLLHDHDSRISFATLWALEYQSSLPESVIEAVVPLLQNQDPDIRSTTILLLGNWRSLSESTVEAVEAVTSLLYDQDPNIQFAAVWALKHQLSLPESAVETLARLLKDHQSEILSTAVSALQDTSNLPESTVEALSALLHNQDSGLRLRAAQVLRFQTDLPESVVQTLFRLLHDHDSAVRSQAAAALEYQTNPPVSIVEALSRLLHDQNSETRLHAARILENQTSVSESVFEEVRVQLLHDSEFMIQSRAALSLVSLNSLQESSVEALVKFLFDNSTWLTPLDSEHGIFFRRLSEHLSKQSTISKPHFDFLIRSLRLEATAHIAARTLMYLIGFYESFATLDVDSLTNVLQFFLGEGIENRRYLYLALHGDVLLVEIEGQRWTVPFKSEQREVFQQKWFAAQERLDVPLLKGYVEEMKTSTERVSTLQARGSRKRRKV